MAIAPRDKKAGKKEQTLTGWRHWQEGLFLAVFMIITLIFSACSPVRNTYHVTKGTIRTTCKAVDLAADLAGGTIRTTYRLGKYTFRVVSAPINWPLTHDLETIDGLSPKEAIRQGRVKNSPYTVYGHHYHPMSVKAAQSYRQEGIASWYGNETRRQKGGHMTANGEAFDPRKPTAAHKLLPLPIHVRVTNLENGRSMIVRVNDRGPFVNGRIIDLSAGASKRLGFYDKGTTRVRVETVQLN
jgi:rare lipoprotein A